MIVSETSDRPLFDAVARRLAAELDGTWVERLDGLDERYWDLEAGGGTLTLHLQHYLGISLCVAYELPGDHGPSNELLDAAFHELRRYDPA